MANTAEIKFPEMTEKFEDLLNEQFGEKGIVGAVMKGTVIRVTDDFATVDVGLKSEGRIPLREFGKNNELKIGDVVEVLVDRLEKLTNPQQMESAITKATLYVEGEAKKNAGKISNGELANSIASRFDSLSGEVFTPLKYAPYVEYGTGLFATGILLSNAICLISCLSS